MVKLHFIMDRTEFASSRSRSRSHRRRAHEGKGNGQEKGQGQQQQRARASSSSKGYEGKGNGDGKGDGKGSDDDGDLIPVDNSEWLKALPGIIVAMVVNMKNLCRTVEQNWDHLRTAEQNCRTLEQKVDTLEQKVNTLEAQVKVHQREIGNLTYRMARQERQEQQRQEQEVRMSRLRRDVDVLGWCINRLKRWKQDRPAAEIEDEDDESSDWISPHASDDESDFWTNNSNNEAEPQPALTNDAVRASMPD